MVVVVEVDVQEIGVIVLGGPSQGLEGFMQIGHLPSKSKGRGKRPACKEVLGEFTARAMYTEKREGGM